MKKIFGSIPVLIGALIVLTAAAPAGAQSNFYMGVAGNYANSNLSGKFDGGDSFGINFRSGTVYRDWLSFEVNVDYLPSFKDEGKIDVDDVSVDADFDLEVLSFIMDAKFTPDMGSVKWRPILFVGLGWMVTKADAGQGAAPYLNSRSIDGSDFCANLGVGVEYYLNEIYSFDLKGGYTTGFGDVSDVKFGLFSLGVSYHF